MKRFFLFIGFVATTCVVQAQNTLPVLMKIGDKEITKDDFEYIFLKNNQNTQINKVDLENYIELFTKFRMKVNEALELGMDTLPAFTRELSQYRKQIAEPYLIDKNAEDVLVREEYQHLTQDVNMSHIMLKLPSNATPDDTLKVYKRAIAIMQRLKKEDFGKVAVETSEDLSAKENRGNIGWLTGMMTVYPLENALYSVPVGQISTPVRTNYGYHIVKVTGRRPAVGKVRVAHILKKFPENATEADREKVHQQILQIYGKVKEGKDFGELANENSDDKTSAQNGGTLQIFGVGRMVPEFEKASFELKNQGDVSLPVKTSFGWHIIKLIEKTPVAPYEQIKTDIVNFFKNDEQRANVGKTSLVEKLKREYGYTIDKKAYDELVQYARHYAVTDTNFAKNAGNLNSQLFKIGDKTVSQNQFIDYVYTRSNGEFDDALKAVINNLEPFIKQEVINYETVRLEDKYPEYRNLLKEYHDGILLFNISSEKVWDRAIRDKDGLETFFKENINQYAWKEPHYKGRIFFCKDKKIEKTVKKAIKKMPVDSINAYLYKTFNKDSIVVDCQTGLWKKGENAIVDKLALNVRGASFTPTEKFPSIFVSGNVLEKFPESPQDVKGSLITDYQDYLEKEWVKELQQKYRVQINQDVLKQVEMDINGH
ncbi:MAG: peptidylprolyl isomerase [Prevotellaceae bacterium]|jgi:peptidyl-prolyl cis-trans isomerase SurA|nr:peptidylprolyl isomerase [Prevotellaceae bacterium]